MRRISGVLVSAVLTGVMLSAGGAAVATVSWGSSEDVATTVGTNTDPQVAVDPAGNATAIWTSVVGGKTVVQTSNKPLGGS